MKDKKTKDSWLQKMQLTHPLIIAGPCSAETQEQVLEIAHQLKNTDATIFRAGIWKPRTRPGHFEGVGKIGLPWLQQAKNETGLLLATEVANANHVELALKHDIDILWIGARSTVSPFIVQEIAEALRGTKKIILVKNPVNPDLALWLGAVERLKKVNITKLGVIHRGFSSYEKSKFRNNPEWQIPIDLQTELPNLPLLLDPSHISGDRNLIFDLCQTALDLNYDGFMVETHHNPDQAWSDAKQQITPATLVEIYKNLKIRKADNNNLDFLNELYKLRNQIDTLDFKLIETLGKRMQIVDAIGSLKSKNNVSILQTKRWNAILKKMIEDGKNNKLSKNFILKLFKAIHQESIEHQKK
ncbi:MAG: bifunctional 3-deoxy-7-phosphoheptulonate synthase/chorismate mutase type II [Flavobacteriales bacterium]